MNEKQSIADSPLFWIYLFCSFGLLVAFVLQFKLQSRQAEFVAEGEAIQESFARTEKIETEAPSSEARNPESRSRAQTSSGYQGNLLGLYWILGFVMVFAWGIFIWKRMTRNNPRV